MPAVDSTTSAPTNPALEAAALDPYLSFQRTIDDTTVYMQAVRLVIGAPASSTDVSITNDDLDGTRHLRIDADTVEFGSKSKDDAGTPFTLLLPGKNVTIVARVVVGNGGAIDVSGSAAQGFSPGQAPTPKGNATVSGAAGADGTPGGVGPDGADSGNITMVAGTLVGSLALRANGGDGGRGEDGGDAGNAADGAHGKDGLSYGQNVINVPTRGGNGGQGGHGGMGGIAGIGGAAGLVTVTSISASPGFTAVAAHGHAGAGGKPGIPGKKGHGAPGGDMYFTLTPGGGRTLLPNSNAGSGWDGADGDSGDLGLTDVRQIAFMLWEIKEVGATEFKESLTNDVDQQFWAQAALAICHGIERAAPPAPVLTTAPDYATLFATCRPPLTQLQLASHQAKISYLDSDFADAGNLLAWICRATTLPSTVGAAQSPPASELPRWTTLNARATTLLAQLARGADYFGNATNYVPLVAYATYQTDLADIFGLASLIQSDYQTYTAEGTTQAAQHSAVASSLGNVAKTVSAMQSQITALASDQQQAGTTIKTLNDDQVVKQRVMTATNDAFQAAVSHQGHGCSFSDILTAITTIVSIGEAAFSVFKDVKDVVSSIDGLSSISGVVDGVGTIISTAKAVAGDANDAESQLGAIQSGFASIQGSVAQAPDASKLIMQEQDFDTAMQPFLDLPEAQPYIDAVHDYVSVVQARNQKLVEYDGFTTQIARLNAEINDQQAIGTSVQTAWSATSDPTLAPIRAFMSALYQDARSSLLTLMYQENQAKNYMLLGSAAFAASGDTISELASAQTDIIKDVVDAQNQVAGMTGSFNGATVTLSATDLPEEFDTFRTTGQLTFAVTPDLPGFPGYADTRLTTLDVTLHGVTTQGADDEVMMELTHSGRALLVAPDASKVTFGHRPVALDYKYNYVTGKVKSKPEINGALIGLSPFTTWTLSVVETVDNTPINPGLDRSKIDAVTVIFRGTTDYLHANRTSAAEAVLPMPRPAIPSRSNP